MSRLKIILPTIAVVIGVFILGLFIGQKLPPQQAEEPSPPAVSTGEQSPVSSASAWTPEESSAFSQTLEPKPSLNPTPPVPTTSLSPTPPLSSQAPAVIPDPVEEKIAEILAGMTLQEKICQMMLVSPSSITGVAKVIAAGPATKEALEKYPVGGLTYNASNMVNQKQVSELIHGVQEWTKIPLFLTCDEEGGRVARLMNTVGTTKVGPMLNYKEDGPGKAWENAHTIASDMSVLGFNLDLAPVADVLTNPENTVIGDRAYSDDYVQAAELVAAAVKGFQEGGVACTLKHFPGHGSTAEDSHEGSAYVHRTLHELREGELLPFQTGIDAGADAVMIGHLIVPDISEEPAVFCGEIVTGLLREEMGFQGVIMTDALEMQAISDFYGNREVAIRAVKAGVDMLLCPMDLDVAIDALTQAVETGDIPESRIEESVARILRLKINRKILSVEW